VRPATPLICSFIDEHRDRFGVAPICRALTVAWCADRPAHLLRAPVERAVEAGAVGHHDHRDPRRVYEPDEHGKRPPESLYGSLKMWAHLQRQGIAVARCTVERLMRVNGWRGAMRARRVRTTVADPAATRPRIWCGGASGWPGPTRCTWPDFTYVPMDGGGFGYTAFVIDAYAGLIPGWECSLTKNTAFVERAIRAAAMRRAREGRPLTGDTIHHSDAGSQYTATHFTRH